MDYLIQKYIDRGRNSRWEDRERDARDGWSNERRYKRHSTRELDDEGHFNNDSARWIVSQMYHDSRGRKHTGEHYTMKDAEEVYERYRGIIPNEYTPADVYVALNAQYHDYSDLFSHWSGNLDNMIVESAICFWFKDEDYDGNKLYQYFNN